MTTDSDSDLFRRTTAWLTRPEGLTFFFLVVTMVVARGPALTSLGYSIDDYRHAINPVRYDTVLVANGRFVQVGCEHERVRLGHAEEEIDRRGARLAGADLVANPLRNGEPRSLFGAQLRPGKVDQIACLHCNDVRLHHRPI